MLAMIDGDLAAYRASAACQRNLDWGDGSAPEAHVNPDEAARSAIMTIRLWAEQADAKRILVCLTGSGNFRKSVLPSYKANRKDAPRPLALLHVRQAIREAFATACVDGLEADDLLGLAVSNPRLMGRCVAVSGDKDLKGTPGFHLHPIHDTAPVFVSEANANHMWLGQALTGDPSDGYAGCPGVGAVRAGKLLAPWDGQDAAEGFAIVAAEYARRGQPEGAALIQARVARILRHGDYAKGAREVRLWAPSGHEVLPI